MSTQGSPVDAFHPRAAHTALACGLSSRPVPVKPASV
jgi:hypothetical protein